MIRFNINTWNLQNITPENISYAQWYRLHDEKTLMMLDFLEYKYPYHTILQIHDKYLQHYSYDPNLLFSLHERCSFAMTLYITRAVAILMICSVLMKLDISRRRLLNGS